MDEDRRLKSAIALTGATGFIGRELQRQLCAAGMPVPHWCGRTHVTPATFCPLWNATR